MNYCLALFLALVTFAARAQNDLAFTKRFVESEDKWVAYPMDKDSSYTYGFIYIDEQAGLTFNYEGHFKINAHGTYVPRRIIAANMKVRLVPNQTKVAFIPAARFAELNIPPVPDWLRFYKTDTTSVEHLYRWGFLYNAWDQSARALTYLESAQKINPAFKGLRFELAYAYNALGQYAKAIAALAPEVAAGAQDCYLYKELSYAQMQLGQLDEAALTCQKGIAHCPDKALKAEIAYNMAYHYFKAGDKTNFTRWAKESRRWAIKGDVFNRNLDHFAASLN